MLLLELFTLIGSVFLDQNNITALADEYNVTALADQDNITALANQYNITALADLENAYALPYLDLAEDNVSEAEDNVPALEYPDMVPTTTFPAIFRTTTPEVPTNPLPTTPELLRARPPSTPSPVTYVECYSRGYRKYYPSHLEVRENFGIKYESKIFPLYLDEAKECIYCLRTFLNFDKAYEMFGGHLEKYELTSTVMRPNFDFRFFYHKFMRGYYNIRTCIKTIEDYDVIRGAMSAHNVEETSCNLFWRGGDVFCICREGFCNG